MLTYRTWLVVDQLPDTDDERRREPLLQLLRSLGFPSFVAGSSRPAVGLRIENGVATLIAKTRKDLGAFLELLRAKRQLIALALHQAAALRGLHRAVFRTAGIAVQLLGAEEREGSRNPYFRRIIRFQTLTATSLDPTRTGPDVAVGTFEEHERLLLDPCSLDLNEQQALELCAAMSNGLLADAICVVLPPAVHPRSLSPASYFHERWGFLRSAVADAVLVTKPRKGEPLALRLWRLAHDELMLDVLREGASLTVAVRVNAPAEVTCSVPADQLNGIGAWRCKQLLDPDSAPGPSWAGRLAAAIAQDVKDAAAGAGDADLAVSLVGLKSGAMSEQIALLPPFAPQEVPKEGLWQLLSAYKDLLPEGESERTTFGEVVLLPSNSDRDRAPDHQLALKAFMAHVWRCPWPEAATAVDPWKKATMELIEDAFIGSRSAMQVMQRTEGWPRATRQGDTVVLALLPSQMGQALQWALQLAVGSIVTSGGVIILDDPEVRLDDDFVLA